MNRTNPLYVTYLESLALTLLSKFDDKDVVKGYNVNGYPVDYGVWDSRNTIQNARNGVGHLTSELAIKKQLPTTAFVLPEITAEDKVKYRHDNDLNIAGDKLVKSLTKEQVLALLTKKNNAVRRGLMAVLGDVNPHWLTGLAAERAYIAGWIGATSFEEL